MSIVDVIILSLSLSMDNMAVAAASGCGGKKCSLSHMFKVAAIFCLAALICLSAGWFGGNKLQNFIAGWDHWVAFALLVYIGVKMIKESRSPDVCSTYDMTALKALLLMALATNIDVLAVGVSMAFYNVNLGLVLVILLPCVAAATLTGFKIGQKLGAMFGKRVEMAGGIALILISCKILIEGLAS